MRTLTLATVIAGLTAAAALTASRTQQRENTTSFRSTPPCTTAWSQPRAMMFGKGYIYVEAPQIVATRRGTAYLGDNAHAIAITDTGFTLVAGSPRGDSMLGGFMVRPDGEVVPIPGPPGVRAFIAVRAVGHAGVAHVFWGGSADTSSLQFQHVNSLWYAQFNGERWTRPSLVVTDTTLFWHIQTTSLVIANGQVHLAVPVEGSTVAGDVLHVVRGGRGPSSAKRLGFRALYTSLAAAADGTLWLATIDSDQRNRARIVVRRSSNNGRSWSEPTVVYRSGLGTAYDPRLTLARDGSLYAAWIVEAPSALRRADSVYVAVSSDRGLAWRHLPALFAEARLRDLWAIADDSDRVQVSLFSHHAEGEVIGAMLEGTRWRNRVTFGPTPFAAILAAPSTDSMRLAWYEWRASGTARVPAIMVSARKSCADFASER